MDSNFIVSARKYRPITFNSVVGQKSVTTTLKNAIKNKHLAHGYLFNGPRGVGKTTCARIFAKTLNCLQITAEYEACNECESCKAFNSSRSYNIHELDAASNNSVEDIRSLIDQVRVPPQIGKYSIYIIDEVHMLSSAAFNAFLKTLEEPPEHAIFILATTEKHKILPTILSRCQIFNFNRIRVEDAVEHLLYVAKSENVDADPDGLNIIAQKADGAMRDALSYFDQIVSFAGDKITYQDVIANLNVLDYDYYFKLTDAFLEGNYTTALLTFNQILDNGFDGHHFMTGLSSHLRDVLVCTDHITIDLLEVGASIKERYKIQASKCNPKFLLKALEITQTADSSYKMSNNPRLHVELALLKLCNIIVQEEEQRNLINAAQVTKQNIQTAPQQNQTTVQTTAQTNPVKTETSTTQNVGKSKLISVKLPQNKEETPTPPPTTIVNEAKTEYKTTTQDKNFTPEQLKNAWLEYAQNLKSLRLSSLFKSQIPQLKDTNTLNVSVSSSLIKDELLAIQSELITFLQTKLHNSKIKMEIIIIDEQKAPEKKISGNDKFDKLQQRNPQLLNLKETFNLKY